MTTKHRLQTGAAIIALVLAVGAAPTGVWAQQAAPAVNIGATDIGGVVRGPNGPEAGVWVIAETTDLPTRMSKIVVTDDQGRYVIPDLPKANYMVWARGYGLVDSAKTTSRARQDRQHHRRPGAERGRSGGILSGDLLVSRCSTFRARTCSRAPAPRRQRHRRPA